MNDMPTRSQRLNPDYYAPVLSNVVRVVLVLVFAYVATRAMARLLIGLRNYTVKMMLKSGGSEYELEKRAEIISSLAGKMLFVLIEMNFDAQPLLAGAGVAGVGIGFGAKNIVKDVLGGMFMMVEEINLRTTVLRGEDDAVRSRGLGSGGDGARTQPGGPLPFSRARALGGSGRRQAG